MYILLDTFRPHGCVGTRSLRYSVRLNFPPLALMETGDLGATLLVEPQ